MVNSGSFSSPQALEQLAKRYPELDLSSIETCLSFLDTTADVHQALDTHFARYGLSMGKFSLLMQLFIAPEERLTPSEFAERANVTRATITGLLDGLEREALVKRLPHPVDRRRLYIHLADKGRELISKMLPDHFYRTSAMMANLNATEKKQFIKLLSKLRTGTSAMREP